MDKYLTEAKTYFAMMLKHALDDAGVDIPFPQRVITTKLA